MEAIHKLHDPQCELLLLRNCVGVAKPSYALMTCSPVSLLKAQVEFDQALRNSLEKIVTASGPGFGDWQWRLATLPIKLGGLGILPARDIIHYAFLASRLQTSTLQDKIMSKTCIVSHGSSFQYAIDVFNATCNVDVLSVTTDASAPHMMKTLAKCYFCVIEKDLVPRLAIPMFSEGGCEVQVRDILVDICSKVGIMVRKDASMGFLSEDGRDLRPADLLLFNWIQGKDVCLDVTGISSFAGMGANSWAPGGSFAQCRGKEKEEVCDQMSLSNSHSNNVKSAHRKRIKYEAKCGDIGYSFLPFSFSSLGELEKDAVALLKRIRKFSVTQAIGAHVVVHILIGLALL
ncbi:hypothetical protein Tco_1137818 [Tanacetum coccineum]